MKAMYINAPGEVEIKEINMPVRKEGEVLLKLLYGGICGSDLGSYRGTFAYFDYPRIPGHEFSAEVIEADENNEYGIKPGMPERSAYLQPSQQKQKAQQFIFQTYPKVSLKWQKSSA